MDDYKDKYIKYKTKYMYSNNNQIGGSKKQVRVVIIRHGETDANRGGIVQGGDLDTDLNSTGKNNQKNVVNF